MSDSVTFDDVYTRRVSGERFRYRARYQPGATVPWSAQVFGDGTPDGGARGELSGVIDDNSLAGDALRQYVIGYIEGLIERGLGIAE